MKDGENEHGNAHLRQFRTLLLELNSISSINYDSVRLSRRIPLKQFNY